MSERRASTVYHAMVSVTGGRFAKTVTSTPPIHSARVFKQERGDLWIVEYRTLDPVRTSRHATQEAALNAAADVVGRKAGADWRERFNGPQRYAIGHQQCPRIVSAGTCGQTPEVGTIWCRWHPHGKEVK